MHLRGNWLPGDSRGFRSRDHRIHSSGDYKHKPPADEHADLFAYQRRKSASPLVLAPELRPLLGRALISIVTDSRVVLAMSVGATHAHVHVALPDDVEVVRKCIGSWRQRSSRAMTSHVPGHMWAEGGRPIRVGNRSHQIELYKYVRGHFDEGAWVWTYQQGEVGMKGSGASW